MRLTFGLSALGRSASNQSAGVLPGVGGSVTALVTPFRDGQVDGAALAALCERQVRRGTTALIVCGSTGEASALLPAEQARAVSAAVGAASNRVPVIAGCCAPATEAAAGLAALAARNGASATLCAPAAYSRPTQDGIAVQIALGLTIAMVAAPMVRNVTAELNDTVGRAWPFSMARCHALASPGCRDRSSPTAMAHSTQHIRTGRL